MFKRDMRNLPDGIEAERFGLRGLLQGRCVQSGQDGAGKRWQMLLRDADVSVRTARAERSVRRRLRRCRVPFRQQKGRQRQQVLLRINGGIEKRGLLSKPAFYRQVRLTDVQSDPFDAVFHNLKNMRIVRFVTAQTAALPDEFFFVFGAQAVVHFHRFVQSHGGRLFKTRRRV